MVISLTNEKSQFLEDPPRFGRVCVCMCVYVCKRREVHTTSTFGHIRKSQLATQFAIWNGYTNLLSSWLVRNTEKKAGWVEISH